jgi:hypothetical protein
MRKLNPGLLLAAAIALCATSAHAQGTMLYTWHSYQPGTQQFHASFQIHDWEQAPGTWFAGTHLFDQTLTITSPDHTWAAGTGGGYASGYTGIGNSLFLDGICFDAAFPDVRVYLNGATSITEERWIGGFPAGVLFGEIGFWTFAPVPEPSSAALLVLGLLALLKKKAISIP